MRVEKRQIVKDIESLLGSSSYVYMVSYKGLSVKAFSDFRTTLFGLGGRCNVLKNTLVLKAAENLGYSAFSKLAAREDTAWVTGKGDPGAVAKTISEFAKKSQFVHIKGGFLDGAALSSKDVEAIATLPPREVLQAQLLGVLQAPARNLVTLLNAKAAEIVNVLNAYKNKLEDKK